MFIYNEKLSEHPEYAHYRKLVLCLDAGFAGTDSYEAWLVPPEVTDTGIEDFAWDAAVQHAEMYGVYPESAREDSDDEDEDSYSDNIEGYFEEYNPEEHDGKLICGNAQDFQWSVL